MRWNNKLWCWVCRMVETFPEFPHLLYPSVGTSREQLGTGTCQHDAPWSRCRLHEYLFRVPNRWPLLNSHQYSHQLITWVHPRSFSPTKHIKYLNWNSLSGTLNTGKTLITSRLKHAQFNTLNFFLNSELETVANVWHGWGPAKPFTPALQRTSKPMRISASILIHYVWTLTPKLFCPYNRYLLNTFFVSGPRNTKMDMIINGLELPKI